MTLLCTDYVPITAVNVPKIMQKNASAAFGCGCIFCIFSHFALVAGDGALFQPAHLGLGNADLR